MLVAGIEVLRVVSVGVQRVAGRRRGYELGIGGSENERIMFISRSVDGLP